MSNFTAKHFIALAMWLHAEKPAEPTEEERRHMTEAHENILLGRRAMHEQIVNGMCKLFKKDNPLFDIDRFREAAGYDKLR